MNSPDRDDGLQTRRWHCPGWSRSSRKYALNSSTPPSPVAPCCKPRHPGSAISRSPGCPPGPPRRTIRCAPKRPHFPARAKHVIFLCMKGGPSHVDTFDYKPQLAADDGKPFAQGGRRAPNCSARRGSSNSTGRAACGFPNSSPKASHADDLCVAARHADRSARPSAGVRCRCTPASSSSPGRRSARGRCTASARRMKTCPVSSRICPPATYGGAGNYGSRFLPADLPGHAHRRLLPADRAAQRQQPP